MANGQGECGEKRENGHELHIPLSDTDGGPYDAPMEKAAVGSGSEMDGTTVAAENEEATEAWSGVLFDRFVTYRGLVVAGLKAHGDAAMSLHPPPRGARVLDIGCGFGDTTQQLAGLAGPEGHA